MANDIIDAGNGIMVEVATPKNGKPKAAKKLVAKKAKAAKAKKAAADGSKRGVAKPANWVPEKKMGAFDKSDILTLRKPQARILAVLAKAKAPMTRKVLSEKSGVEYAWLCNWVGQPDAAARKAREERWGFTSLVTAGLAKASEVTVDDRKAFAYAITDAGRKALAKYEIAVKEKAKAAKA